MAETIERKVSSETLREVLGEDLKQQYPDRSVRKAATSTGTPMLRLEHPRRLVAYHITIAKARRVTTEGTSEVIESKIVVTVSDAR